MRHPDDLPIVLGAAIALLAGGIVWCFFLLLLSSPWSHVAGIGLGGALALYILSGWMASSEPD